MKVGRYSFEVTGQKKDVLTGLQVLNRGVLVLTPENMSQSQVHRPWLVAGIVDHLAKHKLLATQCPHVQATVSEVSPSKDSCMVKAIIDGKVFEFTVSTSGTTSQDVRVKEIAHAYLKFPKVWTKTERLAWYTLLVVPIVGWLIAYLWHRFSWGAPDPLQRLSARFSEQSPQDFLNHLELMEKLLTTELQSVQGEDAKKLRELALRQLNQAHQWAKQIQEAAISKNPEAISNLGLQASQEITRCLKTASSGETLLTLPMGYSRHGQYHPIWLKFTKQGENLELEIIYSDPQAAQASHAISRCQLQKTDQASLEKAITSVLQFAIPSNEEADLGKQVGARIIEALKFIGSGGYKKPKITSTQFETTPIWKMIEGCLTDAKPIALAIPETFAKPLDHRRDWESSMWRWLQGVDPNLQEDDRLNWQAQLACNYAKYFLEKINAHKSLSGAQLQQLQQIRLFLNSIKLEYEELLGLHAFQQIYGHFEGVNVLDEIQYHVQHIDAHVQAQGMRELGRKAATIMWPSPTPIKQSADSAQTALQHVDTILQIRMLRSKFDLAGKDPAALQEAIEFAKSQLTIIQSSKELSLSAKETLTAEWLCALPVSDNFGTGFWSNFSRVQAAQTNELIHDAMKLMFESQLKGLHKTCSAKQASAMIRAQALTWICMRQEALQVVKKILPYFQEHPSPHKSDIITKLASENSLDEIEFANRFNQIFGQTNLHLGFLFKKDAKDIPIDPAALKTAGLNEEEIALLAVASYEGDPRKIEHLVGQHPVFCFGDNLDDEKELLALQQLIKDSVLEPTSNNQAIDVYFCDSSSKKATDHRDAYFQYIGYVQSDKIWAGDLFTSAANYQATLPDQGVCPRALSHLMHASFYGQCVLHPESALFRGFKSQIEQIQWTNNLLARAAKSTTTIEEQMQEARRLQDIEMRGAIERAGTITVKAGKSSKFEKPCMIVDLGPGLPTLEYAPWGVFFYDFRDPWHDIDYLALDQTQQPDVKVALSTHDELVPSTVSPEYQIGEHTHEPYPFIERHEVTSWYEAAVKGLNPQIISEIHAMALRPKKQASLSMYDKKVLWASTGMENVFLFCLKHPDLLDKPNMRRIIEHNFHRTGLFMKAMQEHPEAIEVLLRKMMDLANVLLTNPHSAINAGFILRLLNTCHQKMLKSSSTQVLCTDLTTYLQDSRQVLFQKIAQQDTQEHRKRCAVDYLQLVRSSVDFENLSVDVPKDQQVWKQTLEVCKDVLTLPHSVDAPFVSEELALWIQMSCMEQLKKMPESEASTILGSLLPDALHYKGLWKLKGNTFQSTDGVYKFDCTTSSIQALNEPTTSMVIPTTILKKQNYISIFGHEALQAQVRREGSEWVYKFSHQSKDYEIRSDDTGERIEFYTIREGVRYQWKDLADSSHALLARYGIWVQENGGAWPKAFVQLVQTTLTDERSMLQAKVNLQSGQLKVLELTAQGMKIASSSKGLLESKFDFIRDDEVLVFCESHEAQEIYFLQYGFGLRKNTQGTWVAGPPYEGYELLQDPSLWLQVVSQLGSTNMKQCLPLVIYQSGHPHIELLVPVDDFLPPTLDIQTGPRVVHSVPSMLKIQCRAVLKGDDFIVHTTAAGYLYLAHQAICNKDYERAQSYLEMAQESPMAASNKHELDCVEQLFKQLPQESLHEITLQLKVRLLLQSIQTTRWAERNFDPIKWRSCFYALQDTMDLFRRYQVMRLHKMGSKDWHTFVELSKYELDQLEEMSLMGMEFLIEPPIFKQTLGPLAVVEVKPISHAGTFANLCEDMALYLQPPSKQNRLEFLEMSPSKTRFLNMFWGMLMQISREKLSPEHTLITKLKHLVLDHLNEEDRALVEMARSLLLSASENGLVITDLEAKYFRAASVHQNRSNKGSIGWLDMVIYAIFGPQIMEIPSCITKALKPVFNNIPDVKKAIEDEKQADVGPQTSLAKIQEQLDGNLLSSNEKILLASALKELKKKTKVERIPLIGLLETLAATRINAMALRRETQSLHSIQKLEMQAEQVKATAPLAPITFTSAMNHEVIQQHKWLHEIEVSFFNPVALMDGAPNLQDVKSALSCDVPSAMLGAEHARLHKGIDDADGAGFFRPGQVEFKPGLSHSMLAATLNQHSEDLETRAATCKKNCLKTLKMHQHAWGLGAVFDKESILTSQGVWEKVLDIYQRQGLSSSDPAHASTITRIEADITHYLHLVTAHQQLAKAKELLLDPASQSTDPLMQRVLAVQVMNILKAGLNLARYATDQGGTWQITNSSLARKHLIAEYRHGLIAHESQCEVIDTMLKEPNSLMLLRMGAGKSTWIIPELAYLLSEGGKFPVVLVTDELLQMNRSSFDRSTREVFKQASHVFDFSRKTPLDTTYLIDEYRRLLEAKLSKGYIVTSISQLASLDNNIILKKKELALVYTTLCKTSSVMTSKSREDALRELTELRQQIHYLTKIRSLMRADSTQYLADEVDAIFNPDNEYNFACGSKETLDPLLSAATTSLFNCLQGAKPGSKLHNLFQAILSNKQYLLDRETDLNPAMQELALWLWQQEDPLHIGSSVWLALKSSMTQASFIAFVTQGSAGSKPDASLSTVQIKVLNQLQKLLSTVLPNAMGLRAQVDFGLSQSDGITVVPLNDCKENPGTRFSDSTEIAVYHFLYYLSKGPSFEYFKQELKKQFFEPHPEWLSWIHTQGSIPPGMASENYFYSRLQGDFVEAPAHRMRLLQSVFTGHTRLWSEQIRCNAQDILRGANVGGISGTVNEAALPDSFVRHESVFSSKVAGDTLLLLEYDHPLQKGLQTPIHQYSDDRKLVIEQALRPGVNAIINQAAAMEGFSTTEVVAILRHEMTLAGKPRTVAYVDDVTGRQMLWESGNGKLPRLFDKSLCGSNCLFYYGPKDYRGVDFPIPTGSRAAFITDPHVDINQWMQGLWRLRGLGTRHHCDFFISTKAALAVQGSLKLSAPPTVLDLYQAIEKHTLSERGVKNFKAISHACSTTFQHEVRQVLLQPSNASAPKLPITDLERLTFLKEVAQEVSLLEIPSVMDALIHNHEDGNSEDLGEIAWKTPKEMLLKILHRQEEKAKELAHTLRHMKWILPEGASFIESTLQVPGEGGLIEKMHTQITHTLIDRIKARAEHFETGWESVYKARYEDLVKDHLLEIGSFEQVQEQQEQQQLALEESGVDLALAKDAKTARIWQPWSPDSLDFGTYSWSTRFIKVNNHCGLGSIYMTPNYKLMYEARKKTGHCHGELPGRVLVIESNGQMRVLLIDELDYEKIVAAEVRKKPSGKKEKKSKDHSMSIISETSFGFVTLDSTSKDVNAQDIQKALNLAKVALGGVNFAPSDHKMIQAWVKSLSSSEWTNLQNHLVELHHVSLIGQIPGWTTSPLNVEV